MLVSLEGSAILVGQLEEEKCLLSSILPVDVLGCILPPAAPAHLLSLCEECTLSSAIDVELVSAALAHRYPFRPGQLIQHLQW